MIVFLTVLHVIVSVFLILVVLLQQGKGQDLAGAFGGGGSQANVGVRSATTILHRLTTIAAVMFMVTSLTLTIMISNPGSNSVISEDTPSSELEENTPVELEGEGEALPNGEEELGDSPNEDGNSSSETVP